MKTLRASALFSESIVKHWATSSNKKSRRDKLLLYSRY